MALSPERWQQIERLFDEALEQPPSARIAWLETACEDPALREAVERLLAAHEDADDFLDASPDKLAAAWFDEEASDLPTERRIGTYKLIRPLGRGGMGAVYLAERADGQFEQRVALKILRRGLDTEDVIRRFLHERQILASLKHPRIASLIDGGVTENGRPYFVMEHVEGMSIDTYCDAHRLSIAERLELFTTAAEAVQHAHRNLVIHRDLKPSNVMVTEEGAVKLLDFGIAKLLDEKTAPFTIPRTRTGERWMTPEYASPEQISGTALTTASDVYQLGVVLYELLTGHRPFERNGHSLNELERAVLEQEPAKPSTVLSRVTEHVNEDGTTRRIDAETVSRARRTPTDQLRRTLQGDLDTIVLKALRKEPERRYPSAEAFVEDIRRYLAGLPVEAQPDTWKYRVRKFVRRHAWGVGAAVAIAVLLVGYAVTVTVQSQRIQQALAEAQTEAQKAEEVTRVLTRLFEQSDPNQSLGDTLTVREVLDRGTPRIKEELASQPAVQAQLLDVLGYVYRQLGQYDRAQPLLEQALSIRTDRLGSNPSETAQSLIHLAALYYNRSNYDEGLALLRRAQTILQRHPEPTPELDAELANNLGLLLVAKGEYAKAEPALRDALSTYQQLFDSPHRYIARAEYNLATVLYRQGRYAESDSLHRSALAKRRALFDSPHPEIAHSLAGRATVLTQTGDHETAEPLYREALAIRKKVYGPTHPLVATTLSDLAVLLREQGKLDTAETMHKEALSIHRQLYGDDHFNTIATVNNLAVLYRERGALDRAEPLLRDVLARKQRLLGDEHPSTAISLYNLATLYHDQGKFDAAEPLYRQVVAIDKARLGDDHPEVGVDLSKLATLLRDKSDLHASAALFDEALPLLRAGFPHDHRRLGDALTAQGGLFVLMDRAAEAKPLLREALQIRQQVRGADHWQTAETHSWLGACLTRLGRYAEAESHLTRGYATLEAARGSRDRYTREAAARLVRLYGAWDKPQLAAQYRIPEQR